MNETGKSGGQKTYEERNPKMAEPAKKLHRYTINGRKRSLHDVAAKLESAGHVRNGKRYTATAIARIIAA